MPRDLVAPGVAANCVGRCLLPLAADAVAGCPQRPSLHAARSVLPLCLFRRRVARREGSRCSYPCSEHGRCDLVSPAFSVWPRVGTVGSAHALLLLLSRRRNRPRWQSRPSSAGSTIVLGLGGLTILLLFHLLLLFPIPRCLCRSSQSRLIPVRPPPRRSRLHH